MKSWNEIRKAATAFSKRWKTVDCFWPGTILVEMKAKDNAAVHCVIIDFQSKEVNAEGCQKAFVNTSACFAASSRLPRRSVNGASDESALIIK